MMQTKRYTFKALALKPLEEILDELEKILESCGYKIERNNPLFKELAKKVSNIAHYFEAEYEETTLRPGWIVSRLIPGTLKDLGPVSKHQIEECISKFLQKILFI